MSVVSVGPPLADPVPRHRLALVPRVVRERRALGVRDASPRSAATRSTRSTIPEPRPTRHAPAFRLPRRRPARRGVGRDPPTTTSASALGPGRQPPEAGRRDRRRVRRRRPRRPRPTLLGHRPDPAEADAELLELIERAGPEHEEELVRLLDARAQRMHLAMASPKSLMLRHPRLRSLRPDRTTARGADESWPAGAIPGTA